MQVGRAAGGIPGIADRAERRARRDRLPRRHRRRPLHVGVVVGPPLVVHDRDGVAAIVVVAGVDHPAAVHRHDGRAGGGHDVGGPQFVGAPVGADLPLVADNREGPRPGEHPAAPLHGARARLLPPGLDLVVVPQEDVGELLRGLPADQVVHRVGIHAPGAVVEVPGPREREVQRAGPGVRVQPVLGIRGVDARDLLLGQLARGLELHIRVVAAEVQLLEEAPGVPGLVVGVGVAAALVLHDGEHDVGVHQPAEDLLRLRGPLRHARAHARRGAADRAAGRLRLALRLGLGLVLGRLAVAGPAGDVEEVVLRGRNWAVSRCPSPRRRSRGRPAAVARPANGSAIPPP
jgi:hypothetical protein